MFCFIFILQAVHCGSGLEWRCEGLECEILLGAGPCAVRAYFFVEKHFLFANKEFYEKFFVFFFVIALAAKLEL